MASGGAISVNDDLDDAWAKVVKKFEKEANLSLTGRKNLSIDDVLARINPKDVAPDTKTKAKEIVGNVLLCVQRFGDVLASASSVAFGGSQQCFNALNFVITATQDYSKIFEDLTTLIERVSIFLETLRIYLDQDGSRVKLDTRLRPNIYRVLEHFMTILTLATRLTTRKGKAKVFAKVFFFGDDSGVTDALATLETRVSDVVRIQVAVIGKDLSEAARDIRVMKGDMDLMLEYDKGNAEMLTRMETQDSRKRSDETIRSWLNLNLVESERDLHIRLNEERVTETGSWLLKRNEDFVRWCDANTSGSSTIALTGEGGRGKTFLASAVVEYLRETLLVRQSTREVALAYFYAQEDSNGHGGLSQMNRALRSMAWQLATSNSDFYDFVLDHSRGNHSINTSDQVWDILFAGYNPKRETMFYLVLDGIEAPVLGHLKPDSDRLQTRKFVTGSTQGVRGFANSGGVVHISLGTHLDRGNAANFEDIQNLISRRLSSMPIFRQDTSLSNRQEQQRVLESVSKNIQNDFPRLDLVFRELERCVNLRQLNYVLEQLNEPIEVKITRQIEVLNQTLTQDEILEVNTIISCLASFVREEKQANIELVEEYVDLVLQATRIVSLKGQIETRYDQLFAVDPHGSVSWRYDEMENYLKEYHADDNIIKDIHAKRGIRSVGLDLEELDLLEKIVRTNLTNVLGLHGSELFDRYGFAEFFRSKRGQQKETISFDNEKSQVLALWVGLKVLCQETDSAHVGHVRCIARQSIDSFLWRAHKDWATAAQAVQIGRWFVQLLRDDHAIDSWINDPEWSKSMLLAIQGDRDVASWMTLPGVADSVDNREQKGWLQVCGEDAWQYATHKVLLRWIARRGEQTRDIVDLVPTFFGDRSDKPSTVFNWLCERIPECHWREVTRRLVEHYGTDYYEHSFVIKNCEPVLETEPNNWWALFFAAKMYYPRGEPDLLVAHKYLETVTSLEYFDDESYTTYYWQEMLPTLAKCQHELGEHAGAHITYLRMLDDVRGLHFLTTSAMNNLEPGYLVEYLKTASTKLVPGNTQMTCFQYWANRITSMEDTFPLWVAAHHDDNWQSIVRIIETVTTSDTIQPVSISKHSDQAGHPLLGLDLTLAHIYWYENGEPIFQDRALQIWQQHNEYEAFVGALLDQTRLKPPGERFDSPTFSRILEAIRGIKDVGTSFILPISLRVGLIASNWQRLSGNMTKAQETAGTLLREHGYTSCPVKISKSLYASHSSKYPYACELSKSLYAWGLACLAVGNDELAVSLFRQRARNDIRAHVGCTTVCEKQGDYRGVYVCRDCMHVISSQCLEHLNQRRGIIDFCHPDHDFVAVLQPEEEMVSMPVRRNGWSYDYDWEGSQSNSYEPDLEPLRKAQELYGWKFDFPEEPPATTDL